MFNILKTTIIKNARILEEAVWIHPQFCREPGCSVRKNLETVKRDQISTSMSRPGGEMTNTEGSL